ncbi:AsnC family transcriptional regulator [Candidatus Bathyarchaeota archaeon]|nr:MAG: AsnC family transcriptional regulator [Candidatus Bathyarchaeota archaeon]
MIKLDDIDRRIIEILKSNSRIKYTVLARKVGLTEGAVRRRVDKLLKNRVIKRFTIELEYPQPTLKALVLVSTKTAYPSSTVSELIKRLEGVQAVYEVSGQYDVVAVIEGRDVSYLNNCIDEIRKIEGVESTNTLIVLRETI